MRITRAGVAGTILMLLVAGICMRFGFWQLERLEERRAVNAAAEAGMALPPLELDSAAIAAIERDPAAFVHRTAVARGTFDFSTELLLRGRAHQGRPGVQAAVLLQLEGMGRSLVVNRGWMPSPDAATADPRPMRVAGPVAVEGRLQLLPPSSGRSVRSDIAIGDTTVATYQRLDSEGLAAAAAPRALLPIYLEATTPAISGLVPVPPPVLDEGSHFGYAVQWFSFAAIAVIGYVVVVARKASPKARRKPAS